MSFFKWLANGLGTLIGVVAETVSVVVDAVRTVYNDFIGSGGAVKEAARDISLKKQDRLREVNDEIMHLRNRSMSRGNLTETERRRWNALREEREELLDNLHETKEIKAAEKILDTQSTLEKVEVELETTHVLQYNAFADTLGKKCKCGRPMKLQWSRELNVAKPSDFFWGCTGWYIVQGEKRACNRREPLQRSDYGLMTDISAPEFDITSEEFGVILEDQSTKKIITTRINDLHSDLHSKRTGVELATCPVHGEHMILRKKSNPTGLLDAYFLACPHWKAENKGCYFVEKLKSGSQLAALLKSETGRGIL